MVDEHGREVESQWLESNIGKYSSKRGTTIHYNYNLLWRNGSTEKAENQRKYRAKW
jgi:hypothetical protein